MRARFTALSIATVMTGILVACGGGGSAKSARVAVPPTLPPLATLTQAPRVTSSGLQIVEINTGDGAEAKAGDIAYVNYVEYQLDGTLLDATNVDGTPVPTRKLLRQGQILPGLLEGIIGMKVGGKRRLVLPPDLGFGPQGGGNVPPNTTLVFDIDLVEVRRP